MLRKLNFTDRTRIPKGAVRISLRRESDGILAFDPSFDSGGIAAPAHARLYVEAFYRTSYMRFDCGTVGNPSVPENRRLTDIDSDSLVRFRVKAVDDSAGEHRIVAASDDMTVTGAGDGRGSRIPLLPVNFRDLGDVPWRIELEGGGPVLELNNRIESIEAMATSDPVFFALVYPAAVREILTHIFLVEPVEPDEESDEWWSLWMRWARELVDTMPPADPDDRRAWIDEVAAAFCGRHGAAGKLKTREPEETR